MIDCCDCPMCHTYTYLLPRPQHPHFELARSPTAPLSLSPPTSTSITPHHHHIDPSSPPPLSSLRLSPPPQCCCCCSTLLGPPTSSSPSTRRSLRSRSIMTSWIHRRVKCSVCTSWSTPMRPSEALACRSTARLSQPTSKSWTRGAVQRVACIDKLLLGHPEDSTAPKAWLRTSTPLRSSERLTRLHTSNELDAWSGTPLVMEPYSHAPLCSPLSQYYAMPIWKSTNSPTTSATPPSTQTHNGAWLHHRKTRNLPRRSWKRKRRRCW